MQHNFPSKRRYTEDSGAKPAGSGAGLLQLFSIITRWFPREASVKACITSRTWKAKSPCYIGGRRHRLILPLSGG